MKPLDVDAKKLAASLGEAVRAARRERGWTQADLAEASGLSTGYVARLERGEIGASLLVARKISDALGISLGDLLKVRPRAG